MTKREALQEKVEMEAADWVIRLGSEDVSEEERERFERWLLAAPDHQDAYDFASRTWSDLAQLQHLDTSASTAARVARGRGAVDCPPGWKTRLWPTAASLAVLAATACIGMFWFGNPLILFEADYRTVPGEQKTVTLADGSVVDLGSDTALAIAFDNGQRRMELLSGQAYFKAAPRSEQEPRPFVVTSGAGSATAMGTQFAVENFDRGAEVTVVEHQVNVAVDTPGSSTQSALVSPGQVVRYSAEGVLGQIEKIDLDQATAWRRGKLIFNDVPLSKVVAELNRYRRGRIVITRNSLNSLRVSGVFNADDLGSALDRIASELHVRTASVPPVVTLLY